VRAYVRHRYTGYEKELRRMGKGLPMSPDDESYRYAKASGNVDAEDFIERHRRGGALQSEAQGP